MPLTDFGARICLQVLRGEAADTHDFYLSLHSGKPSDGQNEFGAGGYVRVQILPTVWTVLGRTQTSNTGITFPTPTEDWGTPRWVGVYDAVTGGNLIWETELPPNVAAVSAGDPVSVGRGSLSMAIGE